MSIVMDNAKREMALAGYDGNNKKRLQMCIYQLIETFEKQGWPSYEAPFVINLFQKLALLQPISPLLGTEEEWVTYDKNTLRNNRYQFVFKKITTNEAYDTHAFYSIDAEGHCSPSETVKYIKFPYTPKIEYVKATTKTLIFPPKED